MPSAVVGRISRTTPQGDQGRQEFYFQSYRKRRKRNIRDNTFDNEKLNQNNSEKKITVNENLSDNEENPILNKLENENVNDEKNKEAIPG